MKDDKTQPGSSQRGKIEAERRARRQAEALRANLARRKQQTRARAETPADPSPEAPESTPDDDTAA